MALNAPSELGPLPWVRAADLKASGPEHPWLIRSVWSRAAVGVLGGGPKLGKSWFGLDMALSVASATPCLGCFEVDDPGPALVYFAEDPLPTVRDRIEALCRHRGLEVSTLDLHAIDVPTLRLDREDDPMRLRATLEQVRPRLLVLDPLVRMHALDENSSADISRLLGRLTELQRTFDCAIVLVHHTSKRHAARPGESLRGSTDLHAWGASNAYLTRIRDQTVLTLEHRAAIAPDPVVLRLVSAPDPRATHFEVIRDSSPAEQGASLEDRIQQALEDEAAPMHRQTLRARLRVQNHRLGEALTSLERAGVLRRTAQGWAIIPQTSSLQLHTA